MCVVAWIAAALGCGSVPVKSDANEGDSGGHEDAALPSKGPVTVTFFYVDPVPDANVIIYDPSGAVFAEGTTGLDGSKRFEDVPRDSTLTVGKSLGNAPRVYTVVGVQPNDNLVLGLREEPWTSGKITVTASGVTANHYYVGAGCGYSYWNGAAREVDASSGCAVTPTTWNVVAIAYNANNQALSYSVNQNVSAGSSTTLSSWSTDWATFSVNWSNPPVGVSSTSVGFSFRYPLPDPAPPASTASSGTTSFRYPRNVVNGIQYSVSASGTGGVMSAIQRRIAISPSVTLDLGEQMLPTITNVAAGLSDRTRPIISWIAPTDVTGADRLSISAIWNGPGYYEWHIYSRPDLPSPYQVPAIPASWGTIMTPPTASGWTFDASVTLADDESKADWNAVRQQPDRYTTHRMTVGTSHASF
jgi:hypothetical protein